jgi:hypothetical protein
MVNLCSGDVKLGEKFLPTCNYSAVAEFSLLNELVSLGNNYHIMLHCDLAGLLDFLLLLDYGRKLLINNGELIYITAINTENTEYLPAQAARCGFVLLELINKTNYKILKFSYKNNSKWHLLPVQQDLPMRNLFAQVFGQTMSAQMWAWKYGQQRGMAVSAWKNQQMIAHYGGMKRRLSYFGQAKLGLQIGDVMVLTAERGHFTKHGAFFMVAASFAERHVGYHSPHILAYGFPNARHVKIAQHLDLYAKVDDIVDISWHTANYANNKYFTKTKTITSPKLAKIINYLWPQMQTELKPYIAVIRDWQYIEYRYLQRPDKNYTFIVVYNLLFQPLGLVIIAIEANTCRFMDYLGKLANLTIVMAGVCNYLQQQGIMQLSGWFSAAIADYFVRTGAVQNATEIVLPSIIWTPGPNPLQQCWWLTTGDTDFL